MILDEMEDVTVIPSPSGHEIVWEVSGLGDVTGDGVADLAVWVLDPEEGEERSKTYVLFGGPDVGEDSLADLEASSGRGFVIDGAAEYERAKPAPGPAGDINGDGLNDVVLGGSFYPSSTPGRVYVVFGKANPAPVDLANVIVGAGGYAVESDSPVPVEFGGTVDGFPDLNGDGRDEVLVTVAHFSDDEECCPGWLTPVGFTVYLLHGRRPGDQPDSDLVVRVTEEELGGTTPVLRAVGDLDGDGRGEIGVGKISQPGMGGTYVISGRIFEDTYEGTTLLEMAESGHSAYLEGSEHNSEPGDTIEPLGDLDEDGYADVGIGSRSESNDSLGRVYVVLGGPQMWSLSRARLEAGEGGFVLEGEYLEDDVDRVAGGDFDADGARDLLVTAETADVGCRDAGLTYVLHGSGGWSGRKLDSSGADTSVTLIAGPQQGHHNNSILRALGDVTGDGIDDFAWVMHRVRPATTVREDGTAYLVRGRRVW